MRAALTIAGSDSSAGAGIQADLKTFSALDVYGMSAITAVTSQNTSGVGEVFAMPAQVVRSQIECVALDVALSAVKVGMLATPEIVATVAEAIIRFQLPNLVVDPVMVASSGGRRTLLDADGVSIMKARLFPLAVVVTPNIDEASALSGVAVDSMESAREAARRIVELGTGAVVIKGGHLRGTNAVDLLYDGRTFHEFSSPRVPGGRIHGTGCAFAAAIAAALAHGDDLPAAVGRAKRYVTGAIEHAFQLGQGARLLHHLY